jgi:hypothetical protein
MITLVVTSARTVVHSGSIEEDQLAANLAGTLFDAGQLLHVR